MDAWLIVLITIVSGLTLFCILFSIKLRKNKRRAAARNAAYSATIVVQPTNPQDSNQQMPYPAQQQMPYPSQHQNQSMPYPPHANQQMPYPQQQNQQLPYPQQQNQYQQQSNYPTQTQAMSFVPSTNNQPLFNPQNPQQYGIIVSTAPYNPSPSAPPVSRY